MPPCQPSAPRSSRGLASSPSVLAFFFSIIVCSCSAYEFIGRVTFSNEGGSSNVAPSSSSSPQLLLPPPRPGTTSSSSSRTLLVTRSGDAFLSTPGEVAAPATPRRGLLQRTISISEDAVEIARAAIRAASLTTVKPSSSSSSPFSSESRTLVADTERFPFSAVGMLVGGAPKTAPSGTPGLACSGALISRRHVLTAAHCVFDLKSLSSPPGARRTFVSSLDFYPGRSGKRTPLGSLSLNPVIPWKSVRVLEAFASQEAYNTAAMNLDFALVTLERDADASAGWLSLQDPASSGSPASPPSSADPPDIPSLITTAGYPTSLSPNHSMWTSGCSPEGASSSSKFFDMRGTDAALSRIDECSPSSSPPSACSNIGAHSCQSTHGQSGSPIWLGRSSGRVVAILTGSVTSTTTTTTSSAASASGAASGAASAAKSDTFASSLSAAPSASSDPALLPPTPVATKINPFVYSTLLSWAAEDPEAGPLSPEPSGQMPRKPPAKIVDVFGLSFDLRSPRAVALLSCAVVAAFVVFLCFLYFCVAMPGVQALRRARQRRAEMEEWNKRAGGGSGVSGAVVPVSANAV